MRFIHKFQIATPLILKTQFLQQKTHLIHGVNFLRMNAMITLCAWLMRSKRILMNWWKPKVKIMVSLNGWLDQWISPGHLRILGFLPPHRCILIPKFMRWMAKPSTTLCVSQWAWLAVFLPGTFLCTCSLGRLRLPWQPAIRWLRNHQRLRP